MPPQIIIVIMAYVGIMSTLATGLILYSSRESRKAVAAISEELRQAVVFKQ